MREQAERDLPPEAQTTITTTFQNLPGFIHLQIVQPRDPHTGKVLYQR
jgi:hypothetical protein